MKKNIILITLLLLVSGCATTIAMDDEYSNLKPKINKTYKEGKLVVTSFDRIDSELTHQIVKIKKNENLLKVAKKSFSKEKGFDDVKFHDFNLDSYEITGEFKSNTPRLDRFLKKETIKHKGKYYIDIYTYTLMKGYGHSYRSLWGILHVASLGLIPVWWSEDIEMKMRIYDKNREFITEKVINNSVSKWMWSPFIFRNDSRKMYDDEFRENFLNNTVNGLLNELK